MSTRLIDLNTPHGTIRNGTSARPPRREVTRAPIPDYLTGAVMRGGAPGNSGAPGSELLVVNRGNYDHQKGSNFSTYKACAVSTIATDSGEVPTDPNAKPFFKKPAFLAGIAFFLLLIIGGAIGIGVWKTHHDKVVAAKQEGAVETRSLAHLVPTSTPAMIGTTAVITPTAAAAAGGTWPPAAPQAPGSAPEWAPAATQAPAPPAQWDPQTGLPVVPAAPAPLSQWDPQTGLPISPPAVAAAPALAPPVQQWDPTTGLPISSNGAPPAPKWDPTTGLPLSPRAFASKRGATGCMRWDREGGKCGFVEITD